MIDNGFQFNWRGMTREPSYPYAQSQDGTAQARAAYIAQQAANMQGYRPLPDMSGYQPTIGGRSVNPDSNPMTQPELEVAGQQQLMDRLEANEARIEELKQEYQQLQQEQETATEDLERNVAANRAGIGDTSQYNAWRGRVEAREASKQAREADSQATLAQLKNQVDRALMDIGIAEGTRERDIAQANYKEKLDAFNAAARKYGQTELPMNPLAAKKYITEADVVKYGLKHRDSKGIWDSPENYAEYLRMTDELGAAGVKYREGAYYQSNKPAEAAKQNKWEEEKKEADRLVRELVNMKMDEFQHAKFANRWNAGTDKDIKLIKKFYNYDTKTGAFSTKR